MAVTISGMFGNDKTYFADSPVIININGLTWGSSSVSLVRLKVIYNSVAVAEFRIDAGGQSSVSFDISSALRTIWSGFDFSPEVSAADSAVTATNVVHLRAANDADHVGGVRSYRKYSLEVYTEYIDSSDNQLVTTFSGAFIGGRCCIGRFTELERSVVANESDVSVLDSKNRRNGDASTKPTSSPERIGRDSITSWVDVGSGGTETRFYGPATGGGTADVAAAHAPLVVRDTVRYTDFLFVNRRGALETCSAQMLESMSIEVDTTQYSRVERQSFTPSRSLMAIADGGRRSWDMSSGYQTREWLEWWTTEFLMARQWWMLREYSAAGATVKRFVPVTVKPGKKSVGIYDRSKQKMESVEFTVSLALEG